MDTRVYLLYSSLTYIYRNLFILTLMKCQSNLQKVKSFYEIQELENYYPLKRAPVKSDFKFYIQCRI